MMARRWMWLLAGVFAAALVGFAWWSEVAQQVAQPEGCPQDGCRVGYRFEDGGRAPEGWEPFETDDPVVALMDACLTYFMTGGFGQTGSQSLSAPLGTPTIHFLRQDGEIRIRNSGVGRYSTFECELSRHPNGGTAAVSQAWIDNRFEADPEWERREHWSFGPSYFNATLSTQVHLGLDEDGKIVRIRHKADYFGPVVLAVSVPGVEF